MEALSNIQYWKNGQSLEENLADSQRITRYGSRLVKRGIFCLGVMLLIPDLPLVSHPVILAELLSTPMGLLYVLATSRKIVSLSPFTTGFTSEPSFVSPQHQSLSP